MARPAKTEKKQNTFAVIPPTITFIVRKESEMTKQKPSETINPCPFCNAKAKIKKVGTQYTIDCFHDKDCFANVLEFDIMPTKEQVINSWNYQDEELIKSIKESKITSEEFLEKAIKGDKK